MGDGVNDVLMLEKVGFGIVFCVKIKLCEVVDMMFFDFGFDVILYLFGLSGCEL